MDICVIGSGNVAAIWAEALSNTGNNIVQVWSRDIVHAHELADLVKAEAIDNFGDLTSDADLYLIAVSDDALKEVSGKIRLTQQIVVHTSGCTPMHILDKTSANIGVVWSPQSFVKTKKTQLTNIPFCIESNNLTTHTKLQQLFGGLSSCLYTINSQQRQWAHLIAVMVNNFGNALNAAAQKVANEQNIDFSLFHSIIQQTAHNASCEDIASQQTGPAIRNDLSTMQQHRKLLENNNTLLQLYNLFTKIIQDGTH